MLRRHVGRRSGRVFQCRAFIDHSSGRRDYIQGISTVLCPRAVCGVGFRRLIFLLIHMLTI